MSKIVSGVDADLSQYEPTFEGSENGLIVRGYEIEGEYVLDFDWEPDSQWAFLDDDEAFKSFVVKFLEGIYGETLTDAQVELLGISHTPAISADAVCVSED